MTAPLRPGPHWLDEGRQISELRQPERKTISNNAAFKAVEQLLSRFRSPGAAHADDGSALLALLRDAYGKTDPALLDAARHAAQQLADHFNEYLNDSLKPATFSPEEWASTHIDFSLKSTSVLGYIAQATEMTQLLKWNFGKSWGSTRCRLRRLIGLAWPSLPKSIRQEVSLVIRKRLTSSRTRLASLAHPR